MNKITLLGHLKTGLAAAKAFTGEQLAELTNTVLEAFLEMDGNKADKPVFTAITIPKTGWSSDSDKAYPHFYDIPAAGVTTNDRADISILPASLTEAAACGLCPASETLAGKIRVRAAAVPAAAISAQYSIEKGKE